MDVRCKEFENGSALHIAASNLCLEAARCLVCNNITFDNCYNIVVPEIHKNGNKLTVLKMFQKPD